MKQKIIFLALAFFFATVSSFAQQARIDGQTSSSGWECDGTSFTMTASISTGDLPGDTYTWLEQVNGGGSVIVSTTATFTRTANFGESYFYTLVINRGGTNYFATRSVGVNPLPTIGNVTGLNNDQCAGTVEVQVDGLGATFPVTLELWASDDAVDDGPSVMIGSQSGIMTTTGTVIGTIPWTNENRHLYLFARTQSTGCIVGKQ